MINPQYVRAEYDEERNAYVSVEADWIEGAPSVEYRFTLQENEDKPHAWEGALGKFWYDQDGGVYSECFVFDAYVDEDAFDSDVAQIRQEAKETSTRENIDELLAVTDIVKQRAVALGYEEDTLEDLEGLFQDGPETPIACVTLATVLACMTI